MGGEVLQRKTMKPILVFIPREFHRRRNLGSGDVSVDTVTKSQSE